MIQVEDGPPSTVTLPYVAVYFAYLTLSELNLTTSASTTSSWRDNKNEAHTVRFDPDTETAWSDLPSLIVSNRWIDQYVSLVAPRTDGTFRIHA